MKIPTALVLACLSSFLLGCGGSSGGSGTTSGSSSSTPAAPQASPQASPEESYDDLPARQGESGVSPVSTQAAPVAPSVAPVATTTASAAEVTTLTFSQATIAPSFDFATTRRVNLSVHANQATGSPAAHARVQIASLSGAVLFRGRTDAAGTLEVSLQVSTALTKLRVMIDAVGIPSWEDIETSDSVLVQFGPR